MKPEDKDIGSGVFHVRIQQKLGHPVALISKPYPI